jgi:hypothetical protein
MNRPALLSFLSWPVRRLALAVPAAGLALAAAVIPAGTASAAPVSGSLPAAEIAFQANTGHLWTWSPAGASDTGLGMWAGTSPSINDNGEIAFMAAGSGSLWTTGPGGGGYLSLGMMAGTSPSINDDWPSGEVAFQANTGSLWELVPGVVCHEHGTTC